MLNNQNDHVENELSVMTGSAEILQRAMNVTKYGDMLDCFKDLKFHCTTIEKDLAGYIKNHDNNQTVQSQVLTNTINDIVTLEEQEENSGNDHRFILLHDLIEQDKVCRYY
jgi:hypothetical protein